MVTKGKPTFSVRMSDLILGWKWRGAAGLQVNTTTTCYPCAIVHFGRGHGRFEGFRRWRQEGADMCRFLLLTSACLTVCAYFHGLLLLKSDR